MRTQGVVTVSNASRIVVAGRLVVLLLVMALVMIPVLRLAPGGVSGVEYLGVVVVATVLVALLARRRLARA